MKDKNKNFGLFLMGTLGVFISGSLAVFTNEILILYTAFAWEVLVCLYLAELLNKCEEK